MTPGRKRLAGLVLLVGAILVGGKLITATQRLATVQVHYLVGPGVAALDASYRPRNGGPEVAHFATRLVSPDVAHRPRMPPGLYDVDVTLTFTTGTSAVARRSIEASDGVIVTVDLRDLMPRRGD